MVPCVWDKAMESGPYGKPPGVVSFDKPPNDGVYFDKGNSGGVVFYDEQTKQPY